MTATSPRIRCQRCGQDRLPDQFNIHNRSGKRIKTCIPCLTAASSEARRGRKLPPITLDGPCYWATQPWSCHD